MGLAPNHWGPHVWAAIHLICLGAPEQLSSSQQQAYRTFFEGLAYVLPCASCSKHLLQNLEKVPISQSLSGREELFAWSVRLHNTVNEMLGKQTMSLEDAKERWQAMPLTPTETHHKATDVAVEVKNKKQTIPSVFYVLFGLIIGCIITWFLMSKGSRKGRRKY